MAGDERTGPEGRLRKLWDRFLRRPEPDENVAAANRTIEETYRRAHQAFQRALRDVTREERAALRAKHRRPAWRDSLDAFDAATAEMERTIRDLRASGLAKPTGDVDDATPADRLRQAHETLEQLEDDLKRLATSRDQEAETAAEWERRAMMAVRAENDELAREALQRKKEHDVLHRLFTREHEHGVRVIALLREHFRDLEPAIEASVPDANNGRW
jgi:hypothetical protein